MGKKLMLKFLDGSYKECEVTGRDMGGEEVFYVPVSSLKPGPVHWDTQSHLNHQIIIQEVGKDYVTVDIYNWRGGHVAGPYQLYPGIEKRYNYMFGEWSYYVAVDLVWQ